MHYDPYHNLLCLVQGKKTVKLMSPEMTHQLYPMSILGESPNHSHVNFARPDFKQHPLYKHALASQEEFTLQVICYASMRSPIDHKTLPQALMHLWCRPQLLIPCLAHSSPHFMKLLHTKLYCQPGATKMLFPLQAGDALFIPEGWWHQVDSEQTTIAVNFWWQSAFTKSLQQQTHMQQYYLRRLVDGLLDTERSSALASVQPHPALQAFQAAVHTIANCHSSDQSSDTATSDSSDPSSAITGTSSAAAAAAAVAVDAAASPVEEVAQSISAAAAPSQPQDSGQHDHGQSDSMQHAPPVADRARQLGPQSWTAFKAASPAESAEQLTCPMKADPKMQLRCIR